LTRGRWWATLVPVALIALAPGVAAGVAVERLLAATDPVASQALAYAASTLLSALTVPLDAAVLAVLFLNGHTRSRLERHAAALLPGRPLVESDLPALAERLRSEAPARARPAGRLEGVAGRGAAVALAALLPALLYLLVVASNPRGLPEASLAVTHDPADFGYQFGGPAQRFVVDAGSDALDEEFFGLTRCADLGCSEGDRVYSDAEVVLARSEIGRDGTLWSAYWRPLGDDPSRLDAGRQLRLMSCGRRSCDGSESVLDRHPEPAPQGVPPIGITTKADGLPVLVYREPSATERPPDGIGDYGRFFKIVECLDPDCARTRVQRLGGPRPESFPGPSADAIDAAIDDGGRLTVAYYELGGSIFEIATCELDRCGSTEVTKRIADTGLVGVVVEQNTFADVELGDDGRPVVGFLITGRQGVRLRTVTCLTADCAMTRSTDVERLGSPYFDWRFDLERGPDQRPLIAYFDYDELAIEVIGCTAADCTSTERSVIANLDDRFAEHLTLEVGARGTYVRYVEASLEDDPLARRLEPLVGRSLRELRCHDPTCGAS
jgi:hypothetical protein